eukprot:4636394-Lingulodinium_polyedra.AAC.1
MAGLFCIVTKCWDIVRMGFASEPPADARSFLGCVQWKTSCGVPKGWARAFGGVEGARCMSWNTTYPVCFRKSGVVRYIALSERTRGRKPAFKAVAP